MNLKYNLSGTFIKRKLSMQAKKVYNRADPSLEHNKACKLTAQFILCCKGNQPAHQYEKQNRYFHLCCPCLHQFLQISSLHCRHLQFALSSSSFYGMWSLIDEFFICQLVTNQKLPKSLGVKFSFPSFSFRVISISPEQGVDLISRRSTFQINFPS